MKIRRNLCAQECLETAELKHLHRSEEQMLRIVCWIGKGLGISKEKNLQESIASHSIQPSAAGAGEDTHTQGEDRGETSKIKTS